MARNAHTTTRPGVSLLEGAALLLAAVTALTALARSEVAAPACGAALASLPSSQAGPVARASAAAAPQAEPANHGAQLRDMLLHD